MAKYHVKKDGTPGVCHAQEGNCPLGSSNEHFSSAQQAQDYADKMNELAKETGITIENPVKIKSEQIKKFNNIVANNPILQNRNFKELDPNKTAYYNQLLKDNGEEPVFSQDKIYSKEDAYATALNDDQMYYVRKGIEKDLNVSIYGNPDLNTGQMAIVELGLDNNLKAEVYADPKYSAKQMDYLRYVMQKGVNDERNFETILKRPDLNAEQMSQVLVGLENGVDVSVYDKPEFSNLKMDQLREAMENNVDVSEIANPKFNNAQMYYLINAKKDGMDISSIAKPEVPQEDMEKAYLNYVQENNIEPFSGYKKSRKRRK